MNNGKKRVIKAGTTRAVIALIDGVTLPGAPATAQQQSKPN